MKRSFVVIWALALFVITIPLTAGAAFPTAPHNSGSGVSCSACHTATALGPDHVLSPQPSPALFNNICQNCHRPGDAVAASKPMAAADSSQIFITPGTYAGSTKMQTSHRWDGSDVNPAAGAEPPVQAAMTSGSLQGAQGRSDLRGRSGNQLACVRCHSVHMTANSNGNFLRMANDQDQMCMDCHRSRAQQSHLSGSHPVNVNYNSAKVASPALFNTAIINANPSNPTSDLSAKLTSTGNIVCSTCHGVHYTDSRSSTFDGASSAKGRYNYANLSTGDGYLLRTDKKGAPVASGQPDNLNICTNCHAGKKSHNAKGQNIQCTDCHGAHVDFDPTNSSTLNPQNLKNAYLIQRNPTTPGASKIYFRYTGSQREYKNANNTGVCQSCHAVPTGAGYPAKHSSTNANDCNECHTHGSPVGSFSVSCDGCHGNPPTAATIGGPNGLANPATGALTNGAAGAHAVHAIQRGMACTTCHNGYESRAMPTTTIDMGFAVNPGNVPNFQGTSVTGTYNNNRALLNGYTFTGPIGTGASTCTTVYCHGGTLSAGDIPNPSWSGGSGQVYCGSCHSVDANNIPMPLGSHQVHAGSLLMDCTACHGTISQTDVTAHMQGSVQWNLNGISATAQYTPAVGTTAGIAATSGGTGLLAPSKNAGGVVTYGTCSNITCHGQGAPTWGATVAQPVNGFPYSSAQCGKCHSGNVAGDVTAASPFYSTAIPKMTANTNAKVGAHTAHLAGTDSLSSNLTCNDCHNSSANHMNGTTNFSWSVLATTGGITPTYSNGTCSNTYCHGNAMPKGDTAGTNRNPIWNVPFLPASFTTEACKSCHGFPPNSLNHPAVASPTIALCADCHDNVNSAGNSYANIFINKALHINGSFEPVVGGGSCNGCHGYPPANKRFVASTNNWEFAKMENYTGGGGAHTVAGHVKASANISEGWANCSQCHNVADHKMNPIAFNPSSNIKVRLDSRIRFANTVQAKYSSNKRDAAQHVPGKCSSVACHFQKTPKW